MRLPVFCVVFTMRPRFGGNFFILDHDSDFKKFVGENHLFRYYKKKIKENRFSSLYEKIEMFVHGKSIGGFFPYEEKGDK